jgi:hypothetical protein
VIAVWLVTRAALLVLTFGWFNGDTGTYFEQGRRWLDGQRPYADYPIEYPPAAALLFASLAGIARAFAADRATFRIVFVLACLLCDAAIAWKLTRAPVVPSTAHTRGPVITYALVGLALYPIWLVRFDLFPSLCVLLAAVTVARAGWAAPPLRAGAQLGLGIALKLYPVLLFFPWLLEAAAAFRRKLSGATNSDLSAPPPSPRIDLPSLVKLGGVAAAVVALSFVPALLSGAGADVTSFLGYHRGRGLQIESSYASVLAVINLFRPHTAWHVASHHAHDLAGPAADVLLALSRLLHPVALIAATWLAWRRRLPLVQSWAALLAVALVSASVFSPQFLLWLFPLALFAHATNWQPRDAVLPITIALLTTAIFPIVYGDLIAGRWFAVALLLVRNSMLFLFARDLLRPRVAPAHMNAG